MRVVVVEWLLVTSRAVVYNTDTAYVTAVEPERSSGRHSDGRINVGRFRCGFNRQLFPLRAYRRILLTKKEVNRSSVCKLIYR